jgi:lipopolysaccharide transport protein LptA
MTKALKWIYILTIVLTFSLLIPSILLSKEVKNKKGENKEPLEITSDRMRSEDGGIKIIFMGNVVGYWGDLKITSDILEIYNTEDKKETEEIIAIGNVFITRGLKRGKGDKAIYIDKLQKIILTGTPKAIAWQESNMIEGRELIFLLEKDRFFANKRVRMKIYPKDKKGKKDKNRTKKK